MFVQDVSKCHQNVTVLHGVTSLKMLLFLNPSNFKWHHYHSLCEEEQAA